MEEAVHKELPGQGEDSKHQRIFFVADQLLAAGRDVKESQHYTLGEDVVCPCEQENFTGGINQEELQSTRGYHWRGRSASIEDLKSALGDLQRVHARGARVTQPTSAWFDFLLGEVLGEYLERPEKEVW